MSPTPTIRPAEESDVPRLAQLWFDGWQDAHLGLLPESVRRARTLASFERRLIDALGDIRVATRDDRLNGFVMLREAELYQFYVDASARGSGVAQQLMAETERWLAARGFAESFLDCAIGNDRAARFYEKCGWQRQGIVESTLDLDGVAVTIKIWRYVKRLTAR